MVAILANVISPDRSAIFQVNDVGRGAQIGKGSKAEQARQEEDDTCLHSGAF